MSGFDIFAWIVLMILGACIIGVFCSLVGCLATSPRPVAIRRRRR
jgi:hypothetical protein